MTTRSQYEEEQFLQRYIQGLDTYSDQDLRDTLLKRYGDETYSPGRKFLFFTLKKPNTFADCIKNMTSRELRDFWDKEAKRRLDASVDERLGEIYKNNVRKRFLMNNMIEYLKIASTIYQYYS